MKKIVAIMLFVCMLFPFLVSCDNNENNSSVSAEASEYVNSTDEVVSDDSNSVTNSEQSENSTESSEIIPDNSETISENSEIIPDNSETVTENSQVVSENSEPEPINEESTNDISETSEPEESENLVITSVVLKKRDNSFLTEDIVFNINQTSKTISSSYEFAYTQNIDLYFTIIHNGKEIENGGEPIDEKKAFLLWRSDKITVIGEHNGKTDYTISIKEKNYGLPVVYITTDSGKSIGTYDDYVNGSVSILSEKGNNLYGKSMKIRVRGNSSRQFPKLSYRFKLDDKSDILGMGRAKNWVLLANHADKSLMRNLSAFYLAEQFSNITYTPAMQPAEVYLNNEYIGVYTIGDHLQVQENRVNIEEGSEPGDTGYFLECDVRAAEEDRRCFEASGMLFSVLSPEPVNDAQYNYISKYVQNIDDMLNNHDEKVWNYLDMNSCVDWLLAKEICGATGMGYDAYMYKDKGGKLHFGPVWDYDLAFGNADFGGADRYDRFYLCSGQWMALWLEYDSFKSVFLPRWEEAKEIFIPKMIDKMWEYYELCETAAAHNFERWNILNTYVWPNPPMVMKANTFKKQVEYLEWYINKHVDWLDDQFKWY